MNRSDWEYVTAREYSLVTEFDLVCDREYLVELLTSILFFGSMFGAVILGWCADLIGRKNVHYFSLLVVIILGFLCIYIKNVYWLLVCRFIIGFFMHGTFPQMYIMISEIVSDRYRAFSNTVLSVLVGIALPLLALKAYCISTWKLLFVVCTLPYGFVLFFYMFVPESVRYLRVRGRTDEAMLIFKRMAHWNKTILPAGVTLKPLPPTASINTCSSPLDLFRTMKMAKISLILGFSALTTSLTVYGLVLAAGDITGHMYRDFAIINAIDIPISIITAPLVNKLGRKGTTMVFIILGSITCIALGATQNKGHWKILRLFFAIVGTACITGSGLSRTIWSLELYPTRIRGVGIGFGQLLKKIGATFSPWIDRYITDVYKGGAFILFGILTLISFCFLPLLRETNAYETKDVDNEMASSNGRTSKRVHSFSNDMCLIDEKTSYV